MIRRDAIPASDRINPQPPRAHSGTGTRNPTEAIELGTTRRLFRINSVSVRKNTAPISSIHFAAGKPQPIPHAARRVRINSALGMGFGEVS